MDDVTSQQHKPATAGVKLLLGDPKKAILKLSIPMIFAMGLSSLYNIVDRIWVSGLGKEALSATGFYFPLMMLAIAFAVGLGLGGGSAVSRRIGARDKDGVNKAALHTLIISVFAAIVFTLPFMIFARRIFMAMGATDALDATVEYATIMFAGTIFLFFTNIANSLLRSEGSATKAMIAITVGAVLNIGLDPLFIYGFRLGVAGAAWASVLSLAIASLLLLYWLFVEKKSYIDFRLKGFRFNGAIMKDIFRVGFPAILMQGAMSVMMFLITIVLTTLGGDDAVAVFTSGWSIVTFATLPLLGMATAITAVSGAAFGAKEYHKLGVVHKYSLKLGLAIEFVIAALVGLGAPLITVMFTWSPETQALAPAITGFLQVIWFFFPAMAGGITSSSIFQGVGKGLNSLIITLLRTMLFAVLFAWLFGIVFQWGTMGVYIGLILASWLSSIIAFTWVSLYIRKLDGRAAGETESRSPA